MGGANNILSDKTGTITQNSMTVTSVWVDNQIFSNEAIIARKQFISKFTIELLAESIGFNSLSYPTKSP